MWDINCPATLLKSADKVWPAFSMFKKIADGDLICVFMKNIGRNPDGVYIVGNVTAAMPKKGKFRWRPDLKRSARTSVVPIPAALTRKFFGRSRGLSIQQLDQTKHQKWLRLLVHGEVTDGIPLLKDRGRRVAAKPPTTDPEVSRLHGRLGELHVLKILRDRYLTRQGFKVEHVAEKAPNSDHDIEVKKANRCVRLVEVKTRVGHQGDPVIISEREIACRQRNRSVHSVFIVYLTSEKKVRSVVEIDGRTNVSLLPRQHWLFPGSV